MRAVALFPLLAIAGCATTSPPPPRVDVTPARQALEGARGAGAAERAPEDLQRAEALLAEAEALAAVPGKGTAERARDAAALLRLSAAHAEFARALAVARGGSVVCPVAEAVSESSCAEFQSRLERSEEEQRRLEERVHLLLKELELTETEVIRTKAKLKGQSKEEASSVVAEVQILLRRLSDEKLRSPNFARCTELLARAEELIGEENYDGAAFLAMTAQDLIEQTRRLAADPAALDRLAPKRHYVVVGDSVNIRKGPSTTATVVGRVPRGATLQASVVRGDWVKVTHGDVVGWVFRPLLQ
jgi:hypothetical protein